jgi:hemolysin D
MFWANATHHFHAWRSAWASHGLSPVRPVPDKREAEFLPAVLEIQDRPPSPLGRAVAFTIVAVFASAVVWASVGHIDIVAVAQGKIIPSGSSKVIQPLESGVIAAIHVRDGQVVKKGQVLIELDPTQTDAEQERLSNEHRSAKVESARLQALIAGQMNFMAPEGTNPTLAALHQRMLREQLGQYQARVDAARHIIGQRKAATEATKTTIARLESTVPMQEQRANAYKQLVDQDFVSQMEYLAAEKQRIEETQERAKQRELLGQDLAALAEAQKNYQALISEFQQTHMAELTSSETKSASLAQEVVKAGQRQGLQKLMAPIDGVVQQLAVHTVGGIVTPAQQLMVVVPQEHQLEIEAWVENKDIGFVKDGQPVEIKVETFPFTRYGLITGRILSTSNDAVPLDKGLLVYAARVSMERSTIQVEDKLVNLSPGMALSVEIKTGQRRLIEFFLSPLLKYGQESIRER